MKTTCLFLFAATLLTACHTKQESNVKDVVNDGTASATFTWDMAIPNSQMPLPMQISLRRPITFSAHDDSPGYWSSTYVNGQPSSEPAADGETGCNVTHDQDGLVSSTEAANISSSVSNGSFHETFSAIVAEVAFSTTDGNFSVVCTKILHGNADAERLRFADLRDAFADTDGGPYLILESTVTDATPMPQDSGISDDD